MNQVKLTTIKGEVYASSLDIAEKFAIRHADVLRAVSNRIGQLKSALATAHFADLHFIETTYKDAGNHPRKMYLITEEGFAMSAFLFKTPAALKSQVDFILEFYRMKKQLHADAMAKLEAKYVKNEYLPFDEAQRRASVPLSDAVKHLHILHQYPEMTAARLRGMITRGELEGELDKRGHMRIFKDQITALITEVGN